MPTQLEILEQEEQQAFEAFQRSQNPPAEEHSEPVEKVIPLTEVLKNQEEQNEQEDAKPVEQEVNPQVREVDKFDYEKEFETHGYKLNPDKKEDPRYLAGKFFSTAGLLKQVSNEKKQVEERFKNDLKAREDKIQELERMLTEVKTVNPSMPAQLVEDSDDLEKEFGDFEVDTNFIKKLDKRYRSPKGVPVEYEQELKALREELKNVQKESYESKFWNEVYSKSPNAKSVSNEILDVWLEQPMYGNVTKKDIYINALNRGDTETVAKLFTDCLEEINNETTKIDPIPQSIKAQVSAQPIKKSHANDVGMKPIFTVAQIAEFDLAVKKGQISSAEADRIEDEIQLAYVEGRVR